MAPDEHKNLTWLAKLANSFILNAYLIGHEGVAVPVSFDHVGATGRSPPRKNKNAIPTLPLPLNTPRT